MKLETFTDFQWIEKQIGTKYVPRGYLGMSLYIAVILQKKTKISEAKNISAIEIKYCFSFSNKLIWNKWADLSYWFWILLLCKITAHL